MQLFIIAIQPCVVWNESLLREELLYHRMPAVADNHLVAVYYRRFGVVIFSGDVSEIRDDIN